MVHRCGEQREHRQVQVRRGVEVLRGLLRTQRIQECVQPLPELRTGTGEQRKPATLVRVFALDPRIQRGPTNTDGGGRIGPHHIVAGGKFLARSADGWDG